MRSTPLYSNGFQSRRRRNALVLSIAMIAISACQTTAGVDAARKAKETQLERRALILSPNFLMAAGSALSERRLEEAKMRFGQIVAANPNHAKAKLGIAEVFLASGESSKAAALFRDLTAISSIRAEALQGEGLALIRLNKIESAAEKLESAVTDNDKHWKAWKGLGLNNSLRRAWNGSGKTDKLWRAWNGLGQIYDRRGQFKKAESSYTRALVLTDRKALVRNNLGYSYILHGRYKDAEKQFMMALDLDSTLSVAMENLRLALAWQGRYLDAMAGVAHADRARMMNNIGYIAMLRGEYQRAEAYFSRAMAVSASFYGVASRNLVTLRTLASNRNQRVQAAPLTKTSRRR